MPGNRRTRGIKSLFLIAALMCLASCFAADEDDRTLRQNEIASFRLADVRLPSSAANVRVFTSHFQDTHLFMTFESEESEARRFATEILRAPPTRGGSGPSNGGDLAPSWWEPNPTPNSDAGQWESVERQMNVKLLLVPSTGRTTVWLEAGFD